MVIGNPQLRFIYLSLRFSQTLAFLCHNFYILDGYELFKGDAECLIGRNFRISCERDVKNDALCAEGARQQGLNLFLICKRTDEYMCCLYTDSKSVDTCPTTPFPKCNTYRVKGNTDLE